MTPITYVAAPTGMKAHSFDDDGTLHSLPIAAWWHDDKQPNLRPVVVTENGALRQDDPERVVITASPDLPSADALLAKLVARLQADARATPAGKLPVGKPLNGDDLQVVDQAVSGNKKGTQDPQGVLTRYLSGEGAQHLSVLGRTYHIEGADQRISEGAAPSHPALTAADMALVDLAEQGRVRVP